MPAASQISPSDGIRRWGHVLLGLGLGGGLTATFVLVCVEPVFGLLIPISLLGCVAIGLLIRRPIAHLFLVLCGFVLVFNYEPGIEPSEIAFGLYYMTYLASWFGYRLFFSREPFVFGSVDKAVVLFLVFITLGLGMTAVFGGDAWIAINEWRAVIILGFYFPVKEACVKDSRATKAVLLAFSFVTLILVIRTFGRYYEALQDVEALYQIMQNRSRTGERLVMMGLLGATVFSIYYARTRSLQIALLSFVSILLAGIVVGQSRTIWLASSLCLALMFLLVSPREKVRALLFVSAGTFIVVAIAALVLDDFFSTVLTGLGERVGSIDGAASQDISLINRFYEWSAVWEASKASLLVGHGFGVPFHFFNVIYFFTESKTFVHNGYLGILYRHGILGFGLVAFIFLTSFVRGITLIRYTPNRLDHAVALTCVLVLTGLAVAMLTEDVLLPADGAFASMVPIALLSSLTQRRLICPGPPGIRPLV